MLRLDAELITHSGKCAHPLVVGSGFWAWFACVIAGKFPDQSTDLAVHAMTYPLLPCRFSEDVSELDGVPPKLQSRLSSHCERPSFTPTDGDMCLSKSVVSRLCEDLSLGLGWDMHALHEWALKPLVAREVSRLKCKPSPRPPPAGSPRRPVG